MNLHLLRMFATVVENQSFSRAAEALEVSQPAVSKAVRELESQLDVVLLDRGGRQFQLSEPGKVLYAYAKDIFALEHAAVDAVQAFYAMDRGTLVIGASTTIAAYWLPPLVAAFVRDHSGVTVRVQSGNTQAVAQWLLDTEVDVALVEGPVDDERLEQRPWREERMVIVAPRDSQQGSKPLDAAKLNHRTWILREQGSGSREVVERELSRLGISVGRVQEVGSNEAIVQSVVAGLGLGMVPRICAEDQIALGKVAELKLASGELTRELYRLRLPRRPISQAALAFEALIA
ncbi:LysR family transcriptional regulator [Uliginosibacterium sp. H3]|uniref:LysR family transcriptional regulator n=1 Tax=Uliginosibacterium silvisoli TaxID=3114758 RepID=A0ABU6K2F4_9RHOO|nr:LysR family transcriptional regulator [Uliginosibacterium sp. H3]